MTPIIPNPAPDVDDDEPVTHWQTWCVAHVDGTATCAGAITEPATGVYLWPVDDGTGPRLALEVARPLPLTLAEAAALASAVDGALDLLGGAS